MQKFNASKSEYAFYDKYFGKQLSTKDFADVMQCFLSNDICFRVDLLPPLVSMLEDLRERVKHLPSYRLFSSSLLIIYDGAECPRGALDREKLERDLSLDSIALRVMRKNSNSGKELEKVTTPSTDMESSDCDKTSADSELCTPPMEEGSDLASVGDSDSCTTMNSDPSSGESSDMPHPPPSYLSDEDLASHRQHIDLRMIDFAHSTHAGYKDVITYTGPDLGYLKGLDSLIEIFKEMQQGVWPR